MRMGLLFYVVSCVFAFCIGCGSTNLATDHAIIHGEFQIMDLQVNGRQVTASAAKPWHFGYLLDSRDAKQYFFVTDGQGVLLYPKSYVHGGLVDLRVYLQGDQRREVVVQSAAISRSASDGRVEAPQDGLTQVKDIAGTGEVPRTCRGPFSLVARFAPEDEGVGRALWLFDVQLSIGQKRIHIRFRGKRLGDHRAVEPILVNSGGVMNWLRYRTGQFTYD